MRVRLPSLAPINALVAQLAEVLILETSYVSVRIRPRVPMPGDPLLIAGAGSNSGLLV
jgi:hypothetical protein